MSKKRMLADVLWEAANRCLWDGRGDSPDDGTEWSCNAALLAEVGARFHYEYHNGSVEELRNGSPTTKFLWQLGAPSHSSFIEYDAPTQRQGVRYMWLLLAMHVAEDEGIEL